tara:strand:+ start:10772 stop:10930 length:159 start_codon:yes stop_codon:yes gene_type:complete
MAMKRYNYRGVNHVHVNVKGPRAGNRILYGDARVPGRGTDKAWLNFGQYSDD